MGEMKALYRKYRPTKLSEVIGQERVTKPLENSLKTGNISHAYLFTGPRGCGKTSVARILAHEVNDFDYKIEDNYTDIIEIDAASNTGVDNIRDLIEKTIIAPTEGKYKVYIIDEVHMLSKSAFNALLKTLEEPPKHVIFIMATTDAYKVPITITSRSQVYNFQLATPDVMLNHLKAIAKKEKINI
ncbi:DNA polymerase III subunit gamma/tau, partial [Candidatus Saccharibacteria bacterium]|nr:DNA polymerase III subunit gamma/tau [Candidatus Saccharibacteria bacterium]